MWEVVQVVGVILFIVAAFFLLDIISWVRRRFFGYEPKKVGDNTMSEDGAPSLVAAKESGHDSAVDEDERVEEADQLERRRGGSVVVYWRWAWLGVLPSIFLFSDTEEISFLGVAVIIYVASGVAAHLLSNLTSLPAPTVGAAAWLFFMLTIATKYLPLNDLWADGPEMQLWVIAYVAVGSIAVVMLGMAFDPIYTRQDSDSSSAD